MRTFFAVVFGLAVAAFLVLVGQSGIAMVSADPTSLSGGVASLLWTFIALTLGAVVAIRISTTTETLAGFVVGELFFGAGLLHRFWHATAWYNVLALLLVIPAALLGSSVVSHLRLRSPAKSDQIG